MRDPDFTLAGGPTTVYPRVLAALGKPVTHHYDPSFLECFRRTEAKVGQVFGTGNEIILLQGEALLGLEAAARSLVRPGMPVLNLVSGIYGHGMGLWLKSFGAQVHELSVPYNEVADPEEVGVFLDAHPEIELLCVVHCGTPSGTLHDCSRIGPIARAHGVLTLVDCASSFGGMPVDPDAWQLDVCVAAPQKCLGAQPGMSLVAVSPQAWAAIERNPLAPRDSFLSLLDWRDYWHGQGRMPLYPVGQRRLRYRSRLRPVPRGGARGRLRQARDRSAHVPGRHRGDGSPALARPRRHHVGQCHRGSSSCRP